MNVVLPALYFGNLYYYQLILDSPRVTIEKHEHFIKQTYRNRCEIYGANGKLDLIVPIKHFSKERAAIHQTQIDNSVRWQTLHWRSIESGYRRSPYFEYYEDKFKPLFEKKYDLLFEMDMEIHDFIMRLLKTEKEIDFTSEYEVNPIGKTDFRPAFDPRKKNDFIAPVYTQVFENKYGFLPNLSILDLLFNCGPQGILLLKKT